MRVRFVGGPADRTKQVIDADTATYGGRINVAIPQPVTLSDYETDVDQMAFRMPRKVAVYKVIGWDTLKSVVVAEYRGDERW